MITNVPCDRVHNIGGTVLLGNAEGVLQVSSQGKPVKLLLLAFKCQRKSGASATNFQPRLSNAVGGAADAMSQFFRGGLTAAGTMYSVTAIEQPFYTDALGCIYLNLDGNVANGWEYEVWFQVLA